MDIKKFTELLQKPEKTGAMHLSQLKSLTEKYPFFQAGRALYLKANKNTDKETYEQLLHLTAAYTTDRAALYEFVKADRSDLNLSTAFAIGNPDVEAISETEVASEQTTTEIRSKGNTVVVSEKDTVSEAAPALRDDSSVIESVISAEIPKSSELDKIATKETGATAESTKEKEETEEDTESSDTAVTEEISSAKKITSPPEVKDPVAKEKLPSGKKSPNKEEISLTEKKRIKEEAASKEWDAILDRKLSEAEAVFNPKLFVSPSHTKEDKSQQQNQDTLIYGTKKGEKESRESVDEMEPGTEIMEAELPSTSPEISKSGTHLFNEWLQIYSGNDTNFATGPTPSIDDDRKRRFDQIDRFIKNNPKIEPSKRPSSGINLAKPHSAPKKELMTETLALVYLKQKKYKKAIQAYKILGLKYPEKSGFFADQIKKIKKLQP